MEQKDKVMLGVIAAVAGVLIVLGVRQGAGVDSKAKADVAGTASYEVVPEVVEVEDYPTDYVEDVGEAVEAPEELSAAERRYERKREEVNIGDIRTLRADGKKIWYNHWDYETGYSNELYIYDSETDREKCVVMNKTELDDDDMNVTGIVERDGVLTIIMEEKTNSNGWIVGTYVWQYDCYSERWKRIVDGCAGAEFVDGGRAVKLTFADVLNPEEPTAFQEYAYRYRTVRL